MGFPTLMLLPLRFPLNQGYVGTLNWVLNCCYNCYMTARSLLPQTVRARHTLVPLRQQLFTMTAAWRPLTRLGSPLPVRNTRSCFEDRAYVPANVIFYRTLLS